MAKILGTTNARKIEGTLKNTIDSFYKLYDENNGEDEKQNILRSIILFSCSGLDAIIKRLIFDCLENVIERNEGAHNQFKDFVSKILKNKDDINIVLLSNLLTCRDSRKELIKILINDLTKNSLQSAEELFRIASYFNIPTESFENNISELKEIFKTRNNIIHQLDIDLKKSDIIIYSRKLDETKKYSSHILLVIDKFIKLVDDFLKNKVLEDYIPLNPYDVDITMSAT